MISWHFYFWILEYEFLNNKDIFQGNYLGYLIKFRNLYYYQMLIHIQISPVVA